MSFDEGGGDERRSTQRRENDRAVWAKIFRLEQTIYGVPEEEESGLVRKLNRVDKRMDRLLWALTTASITFGVGTATIVITAVLK